MAKGTCRSRRATAKQALWLIHVIGFGSISAAEWLFDATSSQDPNLHIAWSDAKEAAERSSAADKLYFNICSGQVCMHGDIAPASRDTLTMQVCGLVTWSKKWAVDEIPWPSGAWIIVRKNDVVEDGLFVAWRQEPSEGDCTSRKEFYIDEGQNVVLQLLLCDHVSGLQDIVSQERVVKVEADPLRISTALTGWVVEPPSALPASEEHTSRLRATEKLTRTQMCDLIDQYPLIWQNSIKQPSPPAESPLVDTLVLYAFSESDGWREDNLFFFLALGLIPAGRYHFVLIVNGRLDRSWASLLDRVAEHMAGAFEWVRRTDVGRDICSWHSVLNASLPLARRRLDAFQRFILMNGSARGPFLPSYWVGPAWPEIFLAPLGADVGLTGVTINCRCKQLHDLVPEDRYVVSLSCTATDALHVQSYLLGFSRRVLPVALSLQDETCGNMSAGDSHAVQAFKAGAFELGLTPAVRALGANLAVTQGVWRGVDFRDEAAAVQACADMTPQGSDSDPLFPGAYGGANAHPLELVFFKTNRRIDPEALYLHTRIALATAPWAVPGYVFCRKT